MCTMPATLENLKLANRNDEGYIKGLALGRACTLPALKELSVGSYGGSLLYRGRCATSTCVCDAHPPCASGHSDSKVRMSMQRSPLLVKVTRAGGPHGAERATGPGGTGMIIIEGREAVDDWLENGPPERDD